MHNYLYTLVFAIDGDLVLVMKRKKEPWLNKYNGLGGKRLLNESPLDCVKREFTEESAIDHRNLTFIDCGVVTWNESNYNNGLHLYKTYLTFNDLQTFNKIDEGDLQIISTTYLINTNNKDIATNIPYFFDEMLISNDRYHYHCLFDGDELIKVNKKKISD